MNTLNEFLTPRTDENMVNWDRAHRPGVDADFARQLERRDLQNLLKIAKAKQALQLIAHSSEFCGGTDVGELQNIARKALVDIKEMP